MIKKLIFLLVFVTSYKSQNIQLNDPIKKRDENVMWSIIFGDRFKKSYIDLYLNNQEIIKNAYLKSDESDGITDAWVTIFKKKGNYYISTSQDKTLKVIKLKIDEIELNIIYKGTEEKFRFKKNNGKYLIISDDGKGKIEILQSVIKPFFY